MPRRHRPQRAHIRLPALQVAPNSLAYAILVKRRIADGQGTSAKAYRSPLRYPRSHLAAGSRNAQRPSSRREPSSIRKSPARSVETAVLAAALVATPRTRRYPAIGADMPSRAESPKVSAPPCVSPRRIAPWTPTTDTGLSSRTHRDCARMRRMGCHGTGSQREPHATRARLTDLDRAQSRQS